MEAQGALVARQLPLGISPASRAHMIGSGQRNEGLTSYQLLAPPRKNNGRGKIDSLTASYRRWRNRQEVVAWLAEMASAQNWVILDTETTGSRTCSEVIEVTVISARGTMLFSSLVNPIAEIEPTATAVHGLTRRHVAHAPRYPDIHHHLCAVLQNSIIVGYNVCFDIRLLVQTARCSNLEFPLCNVACLMYSYARLRQRQPAQIDTGRAAICRLERACQEMGIPSPLHHRAQQDAYATYALFTQLIETYAANKTEQSVQALLQAPLLSSCTVGDE